MTTPERRLGDVLPAFSDEIRAALHKQGEAALAAQVSNLHINSVDFGEEEQVMVYTVPEPEGPWGPGHANVEVEVATGMVILDLVDEVIVAVECLWRPDVMRGLSG